MLFYLGTHMPNWLGVANVPLFVSRKRLAGRKTFPRAIARWALDSGGFTEIAQFGRWTLSPEEYVQDVRRFRDEIGLLDWAAPQDWMCEPSMLARTGQSIEEHQRRTVDNYQQLRDLAPDLNIIPVLQGWTLDDYYRCVDMYEQAGVDLESAPVVGVGSVCRRQHTAEAESIMRALAGLGFNLHAFGFKMAGLGACADALYSADSMAWSYGARRSPPLSGCAHKNCANCLRYALRWRDRVLSAVASPKQPPLFTGAARERIAES